jgi:hypothetical protein
MKTLTIRQPRASLIAIGVKTIETRSWATTYRGPLAIHASAKLASAKLANTDSRGICLQEPFLSVLLQAGLLIPECQKCWRHHFPLGAVIATCNLVEIYVIGEDHLLSMPINKVCLVDLPSEPERSFGDYTPGRFAWILEDVKQIEPVPAKGKLRLWEWVATP